jgi:hypothetical protein
MSSHLHDSLVAKLIWWSTTRRLDARHVRKRRGAENGRSGLFLTQADSWNWLMGRSTASQDENWYVYAAGTIQGTARREPRLRFPKRRATSPSQSL